MKTLMFVALLCAFLTSCMSGPMDEVYQTSTTRTVYFVLPDGVAIPSQIVTSGPTRYLSFVRPDKVACSASYVWSGNFQIPIPCSDRTTALLQVRPNTNRNEADLRLPDGRLAIMSLHAHVYASATPTGLDTSAVPAIRNDYCRNSNYYGATSCITGLPKTTYVSGYYRKNGTYVKPYYRSKK
jgi:hypothetical protein